MAQGPLLQIPYAQASAPGLRNNVSSCSCWPLYICGISPDEAEEDKLLEQRRVDLIHSGLMLLDKHNLIKYGKRTGDSFFGD